MDDQPAGPATERCVYVDHILFTRRAAASALLRIVFSLCYKI